MEQRYLAVGRIKRAVGLKGEVLIKAYSSIDSIAIPSCIFIKIDSLFKRLKIIHIRKKKNKEAVCLIEHIKDRTAAEAMIGMEVYQDKYLLPREDGDEYYWYELKGMTVVDQNGVTLGNIHSIIDTGAQDVLVVRNSSNEILIPMVDEFIKQIDIKKRYCHVTLPPGLKEATSIPYKKRRKK